MLIVRIMGGLGNQMYQYAFLCALRNQGEVVQADLSVFEAPDDTPNVVAKYPLWLRQFPNAHFDAASPALIQKYRNTGGGLVPRLRARLGLPNTHHYVEASSAVGDPAVFSRRNCYLEGFWQNPFYFPHPDAQLREAFSFSEAVQSNNRDFLRQTAGRNTVSLHVRRGDYVKLSEVYGGICTDAYYHAAMELVAAQVEHPYYMVFSDDPDWVRAHFSIPDGIVVDWNRDAPMSDLQLMTVCRHNIICNSTFSWWGAWLNENEDKLVISPTQFLRGQPLGAQQRVAGWHYL